MSGGFLLAYFLSEEEPDGEQVRFALSDGPSPTAWTALNGGRPVLRSAVGECGVRDPFLIRDERNGRFVMIATDLKIGTGQDWNRATRHGSDSILVWESADLVQWDGPFRRRVSTPGAGNTWAPKAFWSEEREAWLVLWASALFAAGEDRGPGTHQRMMMAETADFRTFGEPKVYLDLGHDVIDATFLEEGGRWYRFSANDQGGLPGRGLHIFGEVGTSLEDPAFTVVAGNIGKGAMVRAEGPAVAADPAGGRWYLLADEFGLRGYQLFTTTDLAAAAWDHVPDAVLPPGARHGSLLALTQAERARLLTNDGCRD
ncbi:hypothetical protein JOF48_001176 [Arthrobacter stackebrandtii]|uniref:1,4-beta-xylanase n=1 Tax=Arthrobacter stackebrandtii TaxID=272161 RepID=A0ABS4YVE1_9MICC|nr:glycoside hydrolase family 43 protein [Arthrobacter stackebrandtii]MBP2412377.1 hypothetical protein [Arthrobacter stackebrandtii]PYH02151.1 1,4-beta-xylanase [Arthrobacter stackebrandtii]